MTRAYLRLDPGFDERKYAYPDGAYRAVIATLCLAETQSTRGHFRNLAYLRGLLGKCGRWTKYLLEHGDVVELADGRIYVDGWAEWQEGDHTVAERVTRIRHRTHHVTVDVTPDVTAAPQDGNGSPLKPVAVAVAEATLSVGVGGSDTGPPPPSLECEPALDAYQRFYVSPSKDALTFLDELADEFGEEWTARAIGEAGKEGRGKLLSRAKGLLILAARRAEKAEDQAERDRIAAKRAPIRREPNPAETPEEKARAEAAFAAMREQIGGMGLPGSMRSMPAGLKGEQP